MTDVTRRRYTDRRIGKRADAIVACLVAADSPMTVPQLVDAVGYVIPMGWAVRRARQYRDWAAARRRRAGRQVNAAVGRRGGDDIEVGRRLLVREALRGLTRGMVPLVVCPSRGMYEATDEARRYISDTTTSTVPRMTDTPTEPTPVTEPVEPDAEPVEPDAEPADPDV